MKVRRIDFSPDEWLAGTLALDDVERGIYITACALIYSHGGPIPIDELRRLCRSHGNTYRKAVARLIELGKLIENDGHFIVKRCAIEIEKAAKRLSNLRQFSSEESEFASDERKINDVEPPSDDGDSRGRGTINHQPYSEAKASAAPRQNGAIDPVAEVFNAGLRLLTNRGIPERQARSIVGKARKDIGDDGRLLAIILSVERENPIDPVGYLARACRNSSGDITKRYRNEGVFS